MPERLSPASRKELANWEAEVVRLESALRDAEAAFAEEKPRFDAGRTTYPQVREEEVQAIRAIGRARDDLQLARAALLYLRGKGPRPKSHIELDGRPVLDLKAALATQSRDEVGRLDYIENP